MSFVQHMEMQPAGCEIPFEGVRNFRELGGYEAADGRRVRRGVFFRAPALAGLKSLSDQERYRALGIRTVFDFRSSQERAAAPDPVFDGQTRVECNAIVSQGREVNFDLEDLFQNQERLQENLRMVDLQYAAMPFENPAYHRLLDALRADEGPFLFHCSAGKDRTGVAAMLILKLLDVPDETVVEDYLKTNRYCAGSREMIFRALEPKAGRDAALQVSQIAAGVKEENIRRAMEAVRARYGSFDAYFAEEFGIRKEERVLLQGRYLETPADSL